MKPTLVIVGLGNPGKQYEATRHNAGWLALDTLAKELRAGEWTDKQKFLCTMCDAKIDGHAVLLVKPTTFMNRSGECIRKLIDFYKLDPAIQLLVLVDDIDIPLGTERYRESGGPGTHNGLKSIVETLGEGFPRFRIGIGPKPENIDLAVGVLSAITKSERRTLDESSAKVYPKLREILK